MWLKCTVPYGSSPQLYMMWGYRRDFLTVDMTPLVVITSSLVVSKGVIGVVLYSEAWLKCDDADNRGE